MLATQEKAHRQELAKKFQQWADDSLSWEYKTIGHASCVLWVDMPRPTARQLASFSCFWRVKESSSQELCLFCTANEVCSVHHGEDWRYTKAHQFVTVDMAGARPDVPEGHELMTPGTSSDCDLFYMFAKWRPVTHKNEETFSRPYWRAKKRVAQKDSDTYQECNHCEGYHKGITDIPLPPADCNLLPPGKATPENCDYVWYDNQWFAIRETAPSEHFFWRAKKKEQLTPAMTVEEMLDALCQHLTAPFNLQSEYQIRKVSERWLKQRNKLP